MRSKKACEGFLAKVTVDTVSNIFPLISFLMRLFRAVLDSEGVAYLFIFQFKALSKQINAETCAESGLKTFRD